MKRNWKQVFKYFGIETKQIFQNFGIEAKKIIKYYKRIKMHFFLENHIKIFLKIFLEQIQKKFGISKIS